VLRFKNFRAVLFAFLLTTNGLFSNLINERGFVKLFSFIKALFSSFTSSCITFLVSSIYNDQKCSLRFFCDVPYISFNYFVWSWCTRESVLRRPVFTKSRPFLRLFLDKRQLVNYVGNFVCRLRITNVHWLGLETRATYVMSGR
jgi:hypothetical protein